MASFSEQHILETILKITAYCHLVKYEEIRKPGQYSDQKREGHNFKSSKNKYYSFHSNENYIVVLHEIHIYNESIGFQIFLLIIIC